MSYKSASDIIYIRQVGDRMIKDLFLLDSVFQWLRESSHWLAHGHGQHYHNWQVVGCAIPKILLSMNHPKYLGTCLKPPTRIINHP